MTEQDKHVYEEIFLNECQLNGFATISLHYSESDVQELKKIFSELHNYDVRFFPDTDLKILYCVPLCTLFKFTALLEGRAKLLNRRAAIIKGILLECNDLRNNELF